MEKPPFKNPSVRMPTTVGPGASGSGSALPDGKGGIGVRMPTSVGSGSGGSGSAMPDSTGGLGKRMPT